MGKELSSLGVLVVVGGIALATYVLVAGGIGALINPYTINTWLEYAGNTTAHVEWWHDGLIGLVAAPLTIPAGVITWVVMLFLG